MKVKNIGSNQTVITYNTGIEVLVSYETPVAICFRGKYCRTDKKFSKTTSSHINKWLNGAKAEVVEQSFFDGMLK